MNLNAHLGFSKKLLIKPTEISRIILRLIKKPSLKSGKTIIVLGKQEFFKKKVSQVNNYKYFVWT
jgi:hypothetical protein